MPFRPYHRDTGHRAGDASRGDRGDGRRGLRGVHGRTRRSIAGWSQEYRHAFVDRAAGYAEGRAGTNGLEELLKRPRAHARRHLRERRDHHVSYLGEHAFRLNERKDNDRSRFIKAVKATDGKRLTYRELIGD